MRKKYGDWRDGSSFAAYLWAMAQEPTFWIGIVGLTLMFFFK